MISDSFRRRMMPLYAAKFLRNMVFWYAIEKLFMTSIGFDNQLIAVLAVVYSAVSIVMEIPSGILADRWSRKGVLALSIVCLTVCTLIGFYSNTVAVYMLSAVFWGMFDALNSGTDDAMIYDSLLEERGHAIDFEKEYGIYQMFGGFALFAAGLASGVIGSNVGLREAYLFSIPSLIAAIICTLLYREPRMHKKTADTHLHQHIMQTFTAVFKNPSLVWILITLFTIGLANGIVGEMQQTWLIAAAAPVFLFGVSGALIDSTWGFGGLISRFFTRKPIIVGGITATLLAALGLVYSRNAAALIVLLTCFMLFANGVYVAMMAQMHRQLPSHVRSGASSAANTVARLLLIPLIMVFGWFAQQYSPFTAAWLLVALVSIGLFSQLKTRVPAS